MVLIKYENSFELKYSMNFDQSNFYTPRIGLLVWLNSFLLWFFVKLLVTYIFQLDSLKKWMEQITWVRIKWKCDVNVILYSLFNSICLSVWNHSKGNSVLFYQFTEWKWNFCNAGWLAGWLVCSRIKIREKKMLIAVFTITKKNKKKSAHNHKHTYTNVIKWRFAST